MAGREVLPERDRTRPISGGELADLRDLAAAGPPPGWVEQINEGGVLLHSLSSPVGTDGEKVSERGRCEFTLDVPASTALELLRDPDMRRQWDDVLGPSMRKLEVAGHTFVTCKFDGMYGLASKSFLLWFATQAWDRAGKECPEGGQAWTYAALWCPADVSWKGLPAPEPDREKGATFAAVVRRDPKAPTRRTKLMLFARIVYRAGMMEYFVPSLVRELTGSYSAKLCAAAVTLPRVEETLWDEAPANPPRPAAAVRLNRAGVQLQQQPKAQEPQQAPPEQQQPLPQTQAAQPPRPQPQEHPEAQRSRPQPKPEPAKHTPPQPQPAAAKAVAQPPQPQPARPEAQPPPQPGKVDPPVQLPQQAQPQRVEATAAVHLGTAPGPHAAQVEPVRPAAAAEPREQPAHTQTGSPVQVHVQQAAPPPEVPGEAAAGEFECEFECGFRGKFQVVALHEAHCPLRRAVEQAADAGQDAARETNLRDFRIGLCVERARRVVGPFTPERELGHGQQGQQPGGLVPERRAEPLGSRLEKVFEEWKTSPTLPPPAIVKTAKPVEPKIETKMKPELRLGDRWLDAFLHDLRLESYQKPPWEPILSAEELEKTSSGYHPDSPDAQVPEFTWDPLEAVGLGPRDVEVGAGFGNLTLRLQAATEAADELGSPLQADALPTPEASTFWAHGEALQSQEGPSVFASMYDGMMSAAFAVSAFATAGPGAPGGR